MSAAGSTRQMLERRRERRVPVHLPVLVRGEDSTGEQFEERTTSENLCRGGVAFPVRHTLELGASVEISIQVMLPGGDPEPEFATHGRVVHLFPARNDRERIVGVEFTDRPLHNMFAPESEA
jgi:hypothetical protein